jgi:hypothetical protein
MYNYIIMSSAALSTSEYKGGNKVASEVAMGGRRKKNRSMRKVRGSRRMKRTNKRRSTRSKK